MTKYDGLIKKIYYDPAGFGTVQETYKEVKKLDSTIKVADVKDWYERNIDRKTQLRGFNSYISKGPRDEYEVDLFDVRYLKEMAHGYGYGFLAIDNFTKYMWVIPIENKFTPEIIRAMGEIIKVMGKPKKIYSDDEPGMDKSIEFPKWLKEHNIIQIVTRSHANTAERAIRTFKDLLTRRIESKEIEPGEVWYNDNILYAILLKYNLRMVNRTIGLTPNEATKSKNEAHVRAMLELNAIRKRKYPEIKVGDRVKIYKKKKTFEKERISVWTELSYEVEDIKDEKGQEFYFLSGHDKPLLRHELLKVRT